MIVAVMQTHGLTNLASNDADFDRVSGLTRYAPVTSLFPCLGSDRGHMGRLARTCAPAKPQYR